MQRILTFDGERAAKRFELCRLAVLSGGDGQQARTREAVRAEARLLDSLDAISVPAPTAADADARVLARTRELMTDRPIAIWLTQADHEVLSRYADLTPWTPRASRDAVDLQDWLSAADKVD